VDYVLQPDKMPAQLVKYVQRSLPGRRRRAAVMVGIPDALHKIFQILRSQTGNDFSFYKKKHHLPAHRAADERSPDRGRLDLSAVSPANPQEVGTLFNELLIGVTNFFRDREAFKRPWPQMAPQTARGQTQGYTVRVWIPGCSTGERFIRRDGVARVSGPFPARLSGAGLRHGHRRAAD